MNDTNLKSASYSMNFQLGRKQGKKLHRIFFSLTRPLHISPKKRVKWRLKKKWFNRYEKQTWIGRILVLQTKDYAKIECRVTDVKIEKAGKHRWTYDISSKPINI